MNDDARAELESLFSEGDEYDPMASVTISLNLMMIVSACQDMRLNLLAVRVAQMSDDVKTLGKPAGKIAQRQLLGEVSELLKEPPFYGTDKED